MKPHLVQQIGTTFDGELVEGSDNVLVHCGAYRLKQVEENTVVLIKGDMYVKSIFQLAAKIRKEQ